jgi:hypothetical protein
MDAPMWPIVFDELVDQKWLEGFGSHPFESM